MRKYERGTIDGKWSTHAAAAGLTTRRPAAGRSVAAAKAQANGEISKAFSAEDLAEFLLASWEGAILRMKVERNPAALERFKRIAFETVFKEA